MFRDEEWGKGRGWDKAFVCFSFILGIVSDKTAVSEVRGEEAEIILHVYDIDSML